MKNKYLLIMFLLVAIISLSIVQAVSDNDIRVVLKRVLFEHISGLNDANASLTLDETKGLMMYYLSSSQNRSDVNLTVQLPIVNKRLLDVFDKAVTRLSEKTNLSEYNFYGPGGLNRHDVRNGTEGNFTCTPGWECSTPFHKAYLNSDCSWSDKEFCPYMCVNGDCSSITNNLTVTLNYKQYNSIMVHGKNINRNRAHSWTGPRSVHNNRTGNHNNGNDNNNGYNNQTDIGNNGDNSNNQTVVNDMGVCFDSDGGLNYDTYGEIYLNNDLDPSIVDTCSGNVLNEGICQPDGGATTSEYTCPNGCVDGACMTDLPNTPATPGTDTTGTGNQSGDITDIPLPDAPAAPGTSGTDAGSSGPPAAPSAPIV